MLCQTSHHNYCLGKRKRIAEVRYAGSFLIRHAQHPLPGERFDPLHPTARFNELDRWILYDQAVQHLHLHLQIISVFEQFTRAKSGSKSEGLEFG